MSREWYLIEDKLEILNCGKYFTIVNKNGKYKNHCHVKKESTAHMLVRLMKKKRVPKSDYLRESIKRTTLDEKYIEKIDIKIEKDKQKQKYVNVNKGGTTKWK